MAEAPFIAGLSAKTSVGCCGRYRPFAAANQFRLATAIWKDGIVRQPGANGKTHFQLDLPETYSVHTFDQSWTGRTIRYSWENGDGVELSLRSTLPGARLVGLAKSIHLRWGENIPDGIETIDGDALSLGLVDHPPLTSYRFLLTKSRVCPVLIVLSDPVLAIDVTAHAHWSFQFEQPGAAMFVVPLLTADDVPRTPILQKLWQSLLKKPPAQCDEFYRIDGDSLEIEARFQNAEYAPIPPMIAQTNDMRGLLRLKDEKTNLLRSLSGPYSVVTGDCWKAKIDLRWAKAKAVAKSKPLTDLSTVPEELAYPGDWSWEPQRYPLDTLLALRSWAPVLGLLPKAKLDEVLPQLVPPSPDALRASLHQVIEPVTQTKWMKDNALFVHKGDCSWDPDWYNGLSLSGLERATRCAIDSIAAPARKLAQKCKPERDAMLAYFELFHDWSLWAAWTDARGLFWLPDCCHNGLEGLLAESRLRRDAGDHQSADRLLYLSGKTAVCLMSLFTLPKYCETSGFVMPAVAHNGFLQPGDAGEESFGTNAIVDTDGIATITAQTKNPYCLAGNFPEYAALLKLHGPIEQLTKLAQLWETNYPERYNDWIAFYIGNNAQVVAQRKAALDQEAKDQAAVFYHLAPEIWLRRFVLEEPSSQIESRYKTPLNMVEQAWLKSEALLEIPERVGHSTPHKNQLQD